LAQPPSRRSSRGEIDKFITRSTSLARREENAARLLFAIDATASRQPSWDQACQLQGRMFMATHDLGGLAVQLCYYRGFNELRASKWLLDETALLRQMSAVRCQGGYTQIERLLNHALGEHSKQPVKALVFIGDAVEENPELLANKAGQAGLVGLPLFMFQEGHDSAVKRCFEDIARLSGGAYAHFDHSSAHLLAELLGAVARYAAAGRDGLLEYGAKDDSGVKLLLEQLR
jgi:hypothetical protein